VTASLDWTAWGRHAATSWALSRWTNETAKKGSNHARKWND